jgi:hypothetical protein
MVCLYQVAWSINLLPTSIFIIYRYAHLPTEIVYMNSLLQKGSSECPNNTLTSQALALYVV